MQIYVGNLPATLTEDELRSMFASYGTIASALIVVDKKTGVSEGYGFVEMPVKSEARSAVDALRGKDMGGQPLRVKVLKPDDEFHQHAVAMHRNAGPKGAPMKFRGDITPRAGGAIRRSGKRGS
jgi:RNA recognition motif-containing protein